MDPPSRVLSNAFKVSGEKPFSGSQVPVGRQGILSRPDRYQKIIGDYQ